jgi:hypothetical protein
MLAAILLLAVSTTATPQTSGGVDALQQFRQLAGHWNGSVEWTGLRTDRGSMSASYYETGNGSAVVENLETGGVPMMTTVYHLDGRDLRATHYCAARNQPRLKARNAAPGSEVIDFDYVDATSLESPDTPHVTGLQVRFVDANHIVLKFRFHSAKGESVEQVTLARVRIRQK